MPVGSSVLRAFYASNACFTRGDPSAKQVGGVGLGPKPPKLRSCRCTQPRAAKARASVAAVGNMSSISRSGAICHRIMHADGGRGEEWATLVCGEKQRR